MEHVKSHWMYHVSLVFILTMGVILALTTTNRHTQMLLIVLTAFLYVFWGLVHHKFNHDLRTKIVVEYVLMAILGITFAFVFLGGGA